MTVKELIEELGRFNENAEVHLLYSSKKMNIGISCIDDKKNTSDITLYIQNNPYDEEDF